MNEVDIAQKLYEAWVEKHKTEFKEFYDRMAFIAPEARPDFPSEWEDLSVGIKNCWIAAKTKGLYMTLTFEQLREANVNRCREVFHDIDRWSIAEWANATGGEMGEAIEVLGKILSFLNTAKKLKRIEDADASGDLVEDHKKATELAEQLGNEVADIVIYSDLLLAKCHLSLQQFIINKFNEVSEKRGSTFYL